IVAHMATGPIPEGGIEGRLLDVATGLDISGVRPDALPRDFVDAVLERYPRLDLAVEFAELAIDQAERKPESQAARIVRNGVAQKLRDNPLEGRGSR
ncbi:MAG: cyanamide hydratase, partial [Microbacteriaceae bacterium]|nr:cyanamide hydratase [Microbacteriaceae bacterium]